ncbi:MAG: hypothetical protein ABIQ79_06030 [Nitrospiraceae bacterium]
MPHVMTRMLWPVSLGALLSLTVACNGTHGVSPDQARETSRTTMPTTTTLGTDRAMKEFSPVIESNNQVLLSGDRIVIGTVKTIAGDQIEVEYPESLQPRYLPLSQAREKGMQINTGDTIKMVFNAQHALVDFHPLGHVEGHHQVIKGMIDQLMPVAQERVVIKTMSGQTVAYPVRPQARSKMASMPVGVDAVFLADETGKIVDVTFGSAEAVDQASQEYQRMSNPKSPHTRIEGMVFDPLENNTITIETSGGKKWTYPVRPLIKERVSDFKKGERLTLLIDSDNHVIDVAKPPR